MIRDLATLILGLYFFLPSFCYTPKDTVCRGLRCWYAYYNKKYFNSELPKKVDIDYGPCEGLVNVIACSWTDKDRDGQIVAYVRLIPEYNQAPNAAHMDLLHEQCHLATPYVGSDHGDEWQKCMRHLADVGAFDTLW